MKKILFILITIFVLLPTYAQDINKYKLNYTGAEINSGIGHQYLKNNPHVVTKAQIGLGNVENISLSTWGGSSNITTLGTISSGSIPWARIINKPTTLSEYGITIGDPLLTQLLTSPTIISSITLPTTITIGSTLLTPTVEELNYVNGVTSPIQTQFNIQQTTTDSLARDIDALPTVAETKTIISDSLKFDNTGNVIIDGAASGHPPDDSYVPVLYGTGKWAVETLNSLPVSSPTQNYVDGSLSDISITYATQASVDAIAANNTIQDTLIAFLQREVIRLEDLIKANTNPFPSAPTNLAAYDTTATSISVTWTYSGDTPDSFAVYYEKTSTTVIYTTNDSLVITGLTANTNYNIWVKAIIDSFYSGSSNIININTLPAASQEFDLAGLLTGTSLTDFGYRVVETNNTITLNNNQYRITFAPTAKNTENAYATKQFTGQSDSVFAGAKITMSSNLKSYSATDELMLLSIVDTVNSRLLVSLCALDGADTDSLYDQWQIKYWNGSSNTTNTDADSFALGRQLDIQLNAYVIGSSCNIDVVVNGGIIRTISGVNNSGTYHVLMIGNCNIYNGDDVAITGTVDFDDLWVNSSRVSTDYTPPVNQVEGDNGWFVDKNATGLNNGTSWTNAWTSFSSINWSSISSGDTIYISGGNDSTVYNETLNIGKAGSSGSPIVATKGLSEGHNGKVIIDGNNSLQYNVQNNSYQYVNIENLYLKGAAVYNYRLRTSNNVVKSCDFYIEYPATAGIDIRGSNNIIEYNNAENTADNYTGVGNRDFIQATTGGGHIYRYNTVIINSEDLDDHCDVFQFWDMTSGCDIYNNYMWQNNTKTNNAQGIYISGAGGDWKIYNNIAYFPYGKHAISVGSATPRPSKFEVYNNTIYQGSGSVEANLWTNGAIDNLIIKNNIFVSEGTVMPVEIDDAQVAENLTLDYNLYYTPASTSIINYAGANRTLDYMKGLGFETNGIDDNPDFVGLPTSASGLELTLGSPAIDAGTDLSTIFIIDYNGDTRTGTWEIGAFIYP